MFETITTEMRDGVLLITLNRPERLNAWTYKMGAELAAAVSAGNDDPEVLALVQAPSFLAPSLLQHPADLPSVLPFEHSPPFLSSDFAACPLASADLSEVVADPPIAEFFVDCVVDLVDAVEASLCAFAAKAKKANALRIKIFFMT